MRVKDCMCGEVCWVKPDTKVDEIAKIMNQNLLFQKPLNIPPWLHYIFLFHVALHNSEQKYMP